MAEIGYGEGVKEYEVVESLAVHNIKYGGEIIASFDIKIVE